MDVTGVAREHIMTIKFVPSYVPICDKCGNQLEYFNYVPYFDSEEDALVNALANDWIVIESGLACVGCQEE